MTGGAGYGSSVEPKMNENDNTQLYRVATSFHVGGKTGENEAMLDQGETVSFNGAAIVREDGSKVKLEYANSWRAAIRAGWLTPVGQKAGAQLKPGSVEVRDAQATREGRDVVRNVVVHDDQRNVGSREKVRERASTGARVIDDRDLGENTKRAVRDEGVVIAKLKNPSKMEAVEIGRGDDKIRSSLDTATRVEVEKLVRPRSRVASGDVEEAIEGDELEDLLPDAVSSSPRRIRSSDDGVTFGPGSSTVGGAEEGVVVSRIKREENVDRENPPFTWDTSIHWKKRAALAVEKYGSNIQVLNMILAKEIPSVRKEILNRLYGGDSE